MTQQPPYQPYYTPVTNPRPTMVTVVAVLGIIFGALGLCSPFALLPYFVSMGPPNPFIDAIKNNTFLLDWTMFATLLSFVLAIILLSCSIGALGLKPWARTGLVWYGVIGIVMTLLGLVVNIIWLFPLLENLQGNPAQVKGAQMGGMVGGLIGTVLGLALPIAMLVVMTRPSVKDAFAAASPAPEIPPMA